MGDAGNEDGIVVYPQPARAEGNHCICQENFASIEGEARNVSFKENVEKEDDEERENGVGEEGHRSGKSPTLYLHHINDPEVIDGD